MRLDALRGARWTAPLAAALLGAVHSLALVHTGLWWLALLALAGLAGLWRGASPGRAALLGWCWGTAALGATVWWLFISMHRYGGLPAPLAAGAVALLCAALALQPALALALAARAADGRTLPDALRFAAAWLAAELARAQWFTGFPWGVTGYGQIDGPLAAWAPWGGVYVIGALAALLAALLAGSVLPGGRRTRRLADPVPVHTRPWPALLAVALLAGPAAVLKVWPALGDFTRPGATLRVALLQPNVSQDDKFAVERMPATLAWVGRAMVQAQADLVIAPETAIPLLPDQLAEMDAAFWPALVAHFGRAGGPAALVGVPLGNERTGYTNSVAGLSAATASSAASTPYRYDKVHLVPFGEFIPTGFRWFTELMNIPLGDFNRGVPAAPSFVVRGERVAPNICYEDLFGEELALRFADPAQAPGVLANISNIGWFGESTAVSQHLGISRLRSLELQRPMVRATNTGATAVIDHRGIVTALLPPHTVGVLDASVQARHGLTPFARWAGHLGLWPLWALALLGLAWPARRH